MKRMVLSDRTIKQLLRDKIIKCEPLTNQSLQGASVDCRIGNHFLVTSEHEMDIIDMQKEVKYREIVTDSIVIPPKSFVLGTTIEYLELNNDITVFIEGRNSVGRMGLFIENAGWVDPGFKGNLTLTLYNANSIPIKVQAGRRICQLVFCRLDSSSEKTYSGKYQNQRSTVGSLISKDKKERRQLQKLNFKMRK